MGSRVKDLTGKKFGFIIVKDYAGNDKNSRALWNCTCIADNCGKSIVAVGSYLTYGSITHCGCLTSQHHSIAGMGKNLLELKGRFFGHLLVLERVENNKKGDVMWLTRCTVTNCGKEIIVKSDRLIRKERPMTHCGCLTSKNCSDSKKGNKSGVTHGQSKTPEYNRERVHLRSIKLKNQSKSTTNYSGSIKASRDNLDHCVYCGSIDDLTTDHIIPIDKGGNQDFKNLVTACRICNSSKNASFFIDWYLKTKRNLRSLDDILKDMGFDSLIHLRNYQDSMCPEHIEQDPDVRFRKLVKATSKDMEFLESYYRSLL